tara:strand:- start:1257 stop:2312 length:1056 start_codon:yes stop_codon:yes gene_type:complete
MDVANKTEIHMEDLPQYSGNPILYLDQNVLDIFVKYGMIEFGQRLKDKYQVVYSNETLKEIKRSVGCEQGFLNVLKDFEALHLRIVFDQPGFIETDKAALTNRDVFEAYQEFCANDNDFGNIEKSMNQWLFKFSGGRQGENLSDIHREQLAAFIQLTDGMLEAGEELSSEIKVKLQFYSKLLNEHFESTLHDLETTIEKDIADTKEWNGIKLYRESVGLGPKELNNIDPPNVIEKIWDATKANLPKTLQVTSLEDFFQINVNPINPERPYHLHQKVTAIYNMLNTLGYFPDSKVYKERRFIAAMSDNSHASMASFCNLLLSRDENFVRKTRAVYEYLGVPTEVQLVTLNGS